MSGSASNSPGKRFESRFRDSLSRFGTPVRLFDGGRFYNVYTLADYLFFRDGVPYFFECKATRQRNPYTSESIGIESRLAGQLKRMREFRAEQPEVRTFFALQFYCEPLREFESVYVLDSEDIRAASLDGLKSINRQKAARLGVECPKVGGRYDLTEVFERWGSTRKS